MLLKIWSKRRPKNAKSPLPVDVRHSLLKLPIATQVKLYTHATMTHACHIFSHRFHFDAFSTVFTLIGYNMRFCFDRCVFDRFHTYRICMRFVLIDAFSMKAPNVLVSTEGLNGLT